MSRAATSAKAKAATKRPVAKKSEKKNKVSASELEERLAEALAQQAATGEILRVISSSPTNAQPVFDAIVQSGTRLCEAAFAAAFRYDGDAISFVAHYNMTPSEVELMHGLFPRPPRLNTATGRAIIQRQVIHIPDIRRDTEYGLAPLQRGLGFCTVLAVPMVREAEATGVLALWRRAVKPFTDKQIELIKVFADQAAIAIENVRLFTELEARNSDITEALDQQTATSEILRVISRSQTDAQPVFETIAASVLKLCAAGSANVLMFDGELLHIAALAIVSPDGADAVRDMYPRPPTRDHASGRAVSTRSVVAIPDVLEDPEYAVRTYALAGGFRSVLSVPLMREERPIGAIVVGRPEPGPFSEKQIALLQTFADQAVIAIENVRLFTELDARTQQLTRSVGELKALGEVGEAVSSTLDLETVLRTIVSRATKLSGMDGGSVYEYDEDREEFVLRAADNLPDQLIEALRHAPLRKGEGALGQMAVTREPVQVRDISDAGVYQSRVREHLLRLGHRSLLAVPLLRDDHLLGGLVVNRKSPGEFASHVVELLQTFATQSALAIQNARLFREIEEKSRQLETASRHKSEFLANMSHELRTPLNAIIGFSELLSEKLFGEINAKQEEYVSDILESGRHLLSLINDILDLSKIEAGRMELERSDFPLPSAIENALTLVRERAGRHGITLERTIGERLGTIHADERKVKQVLLNLLSNALKFTPEGGRVAVRAEARDGMAEISVSDTGVGIAPEDQDAVFEEFKQVGVSAKKVEGTGLGLAISRKFVELHGGRIWVQSRMGAGSTFTFTLPLRSGAPARDEMAISVAKLP
ncbi:MAG: GAF domain-containing protein [Pseudomonadota bacterium]|nr:GAF domain-containing protein [Pseudomonadota bacterium]